MKSNVRFASLLAALLAFALCSVPAYSASEDKYKPTPPPKVPAADFESEGKKYLDFTFIYADLGVGTLKGAGIGFNYVSMVKELGWNFGAGLFYLTGEDDDNTVEITGGIVPLSANIAFRPYNVPGGNSLIFFMGIHYSWTGLFADVEPDDEFDITLRTYGPMFGAKARLMLRPGLAFIPYWVFKYENYDGEVNVNGTVYDLDIDSAAIHLIGFDIEIGAISIGAMLDMISNSDRDMIIISFTYNLDYDEGAPAQSADTAAPRATQRGRAAK